MTKYRIIDSWFESEGDELEYVAVIKVDGVEEQKEVRLGKNWLGAKTVKETIELFAEKVREAF